MLENMNTEIRKQVAQMIDFNHKAFSWQLEQADKFNKQLREQTDAAVKFSMDSAKVSVDSFLAAQRAVLDAMTPENNAN